MRLCHTLVLPPGVYRRVVQISLALVVLLGGAVREGVEEEVAQVPARLTPRMIVLRAIDNVLD